MSTPPPASTPSTAPGYELRRQPAKRRLPVIRALLALLALAILSLFEPHCFRFAIRHFIELEAWRCGVNVQMRQVQGSLFETVRVLDSVWIYESENGPVTRLEVKEIEADLAWRALFARGSVPWFRQLTLEGLTGKVQLPIDQPALPTPRGFELPRPQGRWLAAPERIEARNADFIFESDGDYVRLQNTRFTISEMEPGELLVGQLVIKQPWLNRTFRNVSGTTKLDNSRTELAAVLLEPGVSVQSLAVELGEIARGRLNLEMQIAAFGGGIRIETQTLPRGRQLAFEASGTFSQIAIGKLATFLGQSDAAGGTIKEGKFTFRGSPQSPAKATASLRIEATDFQWESRQWDSLVLGASLLDGRVQIPELDLHQGHNFLNLHGEFALPEPEQEWWQNEFSFDVNAKIENLTELSALLLPEFKYAAGKGTIDGSVRGDHQQFHGQVIVSGSNLTWRNAPIEELHATLKLNGNELQLSNLSLFNDGDFVRGRGVVNILGDKQYWGDLHASIDDLARYSALLQKPIVPEPIAGGAVIDWAGEGSARGHTGKFLARLRKLRSLGATSSLLHPINAEFEGTYQPGAFLFSRFGLSDDASAFTANVSVGEKFVSLQGIRFTHAGAVQLQGDALLPLDLWQSWPNASAATLLSDTTVSKVHLTASALDLHAASQLTGWNFPLEGIARGEITAEGAPGALTTSGKLSLAKARIPLGWTGVLVSDVNAEATLAGQKLTLASLTGRAPTGDVKLGGEVDFANVRDPHLHLTLTSQQSSWPLMLPPPFPAGPVSFGGSLALTIEGASSAANVTGSIQLVPLDSAAGVSLAQTLPLDLTPTVLGTSPAVPDLINFPAGPWDSWTLDVACTSVRPGFQSDHALIDLRLQGTLASPAPVGSARFTEFDGWIGQQRVPLDEFLIEWRAGSPGDPSITLSAPGLLFGERFIAHAAGPLSHLLRFFEFDPPLTDEMIRENLNGTAATLDTTFSLFTPLALATGVDAYAWPAIPPDEAPASAPQ